MSIQSHFFHTSIVVQQPQRKSLETRPHSPLDHLSRPHSSLDHLTLLILGQSTLKTFVPSYTIISKIKMLGVEMAGLRKCLQKPSMRGKKG
jgi:hypothetical protein